MHATKDKVESDTSTVYSISSYESTITTRDELWFGELKLALGVIGLPVTTHDRILRCSPPLGKNGKVHANKLSNEEQEESKAYTERTQKKEVWKRSIRAHSLRFLGPKQCMKRMFLDTPRTWILYKPMDRDKSLLLAMTSSFITSSFPYPSPLFSVTHQMALSLYL
ncbi:hypothetical protein Cgig2_002573 [Carnegiea gigantea]|uniref:NADH dehydrogenase subunit 2 n=1 Tax=Carnegiea gigantea TaxID=171969 RepID=A0A9Q1GJW7_9CARY|nr:hypothetical protein Cgig2_002573 [Carnegiea gigantea]